VATRSKEKAGAGGWNPRMAGLVVCAFFAMGVMTGFSEPGRAVAIRTIATLSRSRDHLLDSLAPELKLAERYFSIVAEWTARTGLYRAARPRSASDSNSSRDALSSGAIAIIERHDGFYALFDGGELRGPVSAVNETDLPVLSGPALENAAGARMVEYATVLIRAEAQLSELISEMQVADDGTASLFLERERTELIIDVDRAALELQRAIRVREQWAGREKLIAALDMTTPGQAVVRLHGAEHAPWKHKIGIQKISAKSLEPGAGQLRRSP
jgi:hypothetical protein